MFRNLNTKVPTIRRLMANQPRRDLQGLVIGVPKESLEGEKRVALVPVNVTKLKKAGALVNIETSAGLGSGYSDSDYVKAGKLF